MKTNTTASSVGELAPAGRFHGGSFGVSGTPPGAYDDMPSLWFVIYHDQGVDTGRVRPVRAVVWTVRLTVRIHRATVCAVVWKHVSLAGTCGTGDCITPSSVAAGGGVFHARGIMDGKSCDGCLWVGSVDGLKPLENKGD
jgi:hypothetical protein